MADDPKFLRPDEVSNRYGGAITVNTLSKWRCNGMRQGPPFHRIGGRIFYPLDRLIEWEGSRSFNATADYAAVKPLPATGAGPAQASVR
jgi:hypothetical protein